MIENPRSIAQTWPNPRLRMIAELTIIIAEAPWTLTREHLRRAFSAGLSEDDVLHLVGLAAYFGHLNRIADVVAGELDYHVLLQPPPPDPDVPAWPMANALVAGRPALDMARRPATANAFTEWKHYIFYSRDVPLTRRQRTLLARWVAAWLGDGGISPPTDLTVNPLDDQLRAVAEVVTLAPWQITDATFAPLRAFGFDDATIFDVCATVTSAGVFSRIAVALAAFGS